MAQIAGVELNTPYVESGPENLGGLSFGDLITPFVQGVISGGITVIPSRFPVPPVAWGFLTTVFDEADEPLAFDRVTSRGSIAGAVPPEGIYLEPTIGQIWPR